jgi:uncharacterized protein YpuA (DUF1002 family)
MKIKNLISNLLITTLTASILLTAGYSIPVLADSFTVVTLGADLSDAQKKEMLDYFEVTKDDASIIEITSKEEYEALGDVASSDQLGIKAISCSYIEPTTKGGLKITTNNLTWVSDGMIRNALITAGVENAKVIAAAPFKVSGTAALTGILKGFENSSGGETLNTASKEAANEEIVVTGDLGDKIGQDDATNLINDIKKNIIKDKPSNDEELTKIINESIDKYNYKLSADDIEGIKSLMSKINGLNLDYSSLKDELNSISDDLKDKISAEEVSGFFQKLGAFFSSIRDSIANFFN